jgi:membrane-associated phospholipid phosphatase
MASAFGHNIPLIMNSSSAAGVSIVVDRLRFEWRLKLILAVLLNLWVYVPYHFLQGHQIFPATTISATFFDRLVPFSDKAVWIYLSVYLLTPIGPSLMNSREQIVRYSIGIILIGVLADLVFLFWPTLCLRPVATGTNAAYRLLILIDNPFDAFPSLHAAFVVFSALCAGRVLRELGSKNAWCGAVWAWAVLILIATLATKQHMAVDVAAGITLAFGVYIGVFHQWRPSLNTNVVLQSVPTNPTQHQANIL